MNNQEFIDIINWSSIFIFKSFIFFSSKNKEDFGNFKNSDLILNNIVKQYNNYFIFNDIKTDKNRLIRTFFFKCINCLINNKIVKEDKKVSSTSKHTFSIKFWSIDIDILTEKYCRNFDFSYIKYEIIKKEKEYYQKGIFFWNIYHINPKNFRSDESFNPKENYIELLNSVEVFIDLENLKWIKNDYMEEYKYLEAESPKKISETILKHRLDENWSINTEKEIKELQKKYSKAIEYINIKIFLNLKFEDNEKIFFSFFFEFRGRKMYNSSISPTFCKITRFLLHYGIYDNDDFSEKILIKEIEEKKEKIIEICKKNDIWYKDIYIESIFWLLIGIGKIIIKKTDIYITTDVFLKCSDLVLGCEIKEMKIKFYEKVEIKHYINCLHSFKKEKIKKRIIIKDGTASVYQISMIILEPKNEEALRLVNLKNSHEWVDTYSFIINKFKENYIKNKKKIGKLYEKLDEVLVRDIAKKPLMTIPYSIGLKECYNDFCEALMEKHPEVSINVELENLFKAFYWYAKNMIEISTLYKISTKKYVNEVIENFKKERNIIIISELGSSNLKYMKTIEKAIDISQIIKIIETNEVIKKRYTKSIKILSDSIDVSQTKTALAPNIRHYWEGECLRQTELSLGRGLITIHDAELIDFNSCSKLIIAKNKVFKKLVKNENIWSMYIYI